MVDPLAGVLISTRYRLIGQLGSGETGIVWDARDEQLNLPVAIKELRLPEPGSPQRLADLLQLVRAEARYTGQLAHSNIVAVYDVASDFDRPWVIMPRVTGRSLGADIAADGTWDHARAARLGLQLIEALEAAHAEGVSHGAIKPSNVLIPEFGGPMLTDFSLTPSPLEADLLGLGSVVYFAVEGHAPHPAEPEPPRNAGPLTEAVEGLLASDPGQRSTLAQAREQFTAALAAIAEQRKKAQSSAGVTPAFDSTPVTELPPVPAPPPPPAPITLPLASTTLAPNPAAIPLNRAAAASSPTPTPGPAATPPSPAASSAAHRAAASPSAPQELVTGPPSSARATAPPAVPGPAPAAIGRASAPPGFVAAPPAPMPSKAGDAATSTPPDPAPAPLARGYVMAAPVRGPAPAGPAPEAVPVPAPGHGTSEPAPAAPATAPSPAPAPAPAAQDPVATSAKADLAEPARTATPSAPDHARVRGHAAAPPNRRRLVIAVAVIVAVAAITGVAFAFLRSPGTEAARPQPTVSATAAPDTTVPQQPVNVTVSGRSTDTVTLVWDAGIDNVGVIEYHVQRDGTQVGTTETPDYTDKGLAANTTHTYTVTAVDAAGNISAASAAVTATTLKVPDTIRPSAPGNLRITGRSTNSIVLVWTAATDDIGVARYEVRRDGTVVATVAALQYTDSGLAPATSHSYVVVAIDATGNRSNPSAPVTGVTLTAPDTAAPSTPGLPHVTGTTSTTISLAWIASTDNTGVTNYLVYRNGILVASPTALTYTDPGLTPGTTYAYQIKAIDGAGNVSAAAVISAATVAPQVSSINADVSIGTVPACTVTITATVAVTAGPVTVDLQVVINSVTSTTSVSFPGIGPASQVVNVGTGSGTQDGTVQVSSTSPNPASSTKTWTAPDACRPGFTVTSPSAQADSCGPPTISGSVRVTTRNNPGPEQYTVEMIIDGGKVAETTITLAPNSSDVVSLTSADPYPNGNYAVSYVVTLQGGPSATSSTVNTEVNC